MTALRPTETSRVRGVAAETYPSNRICAHPDCDKQVDLRPDGTPTVHHIFARSLTKSSSYFVEIEEGIEADANLPAPEETVKKVIPHAVGLCGSGTTGHHGDVEEHRAWIRLEDGEFVWYSRVAPTDPYDEIPADWQEWLRIGALNPQPGSVDGKPKRKRTQKGSAERAARKTVSVRLPEDFGGDDWDDLISEAEKVELSQRDTKFDPGRSSVAVGKLLVAILERFTGRAA